MSSGMQAAVAMDGWGPRWIGTIVIAHVVPLANPDKLAIFNFRTAGNVSKQEGFTVTDLLPMWWGHPYLPSLTAAAQFERRLTVSSGNAPTLAGGSPVGSWGGAFNSFWGYERGVVGIESGSWLLEVRSLATGQVLVAGGISITLQVT